MKNTTMGLAKLEEEILAFDVSDEALEIAAGTEGEGELHPRRLHRPVRLPDG